MNETRIERIVSKFIAKGFLLSGGAAVATLIVLIAVAPLVLAPPAFPQSTASAMRLQAGIAKEDVDGDLKSAMEIYRKLADDRSAPRDVRSRALLRLAGCYEKLGQKAQNVYEQVVRDFGDQPAAAQARSHLASLAQRERLGLVKTMSVRKIEGTELGCVGPTDTDGQRAVYCSNGAIYFGDLAGHRRQLVFKGTDWNRFYASRDLSMAVLIFDGKQVPSRVAVINTDGTGYRELLQDETPGGWNTVSGIPSYCCVLSWDNRYLPVAINSPTGGGRLLVVSVADAKRRELRSLETGQFVKAMFSPDGRFVAYETAPQLGEVDSFRVFVVPAQGGTPNLVYQSTPKHRDPIFRERLSLMDWTADGRFLAIAEANYGKTGLYLYPIKNGVAEGAPVLVRDGDFRAGRSTPAGGFIYSDQKMAGNTEIHLASLDAEGRLGNWRPVDFPRGNGFNPFPFFSPDGRNIGFVQEQTPTGGGTLVLRNLSTGQERELYRSDAEFLSCLYASHIPKVFCSESKTRETDLLAIAVESGEIERLGSIAGDGYLLIQSSHDDQNLYLKKRWPMKYPNPLIRWDLARRQESLVVDDQPADIVEDYPSPDNRWVIRVSTQGLLVRSISGGDWRSLASFRDRSRDLGHITVMPDDNWVLYHDTDTAGKHALFRVPIAGGQPERVGDFPGDSFGGSLSVSPDGRQIIAVTWHYEEELWILDHFLPSGK